MSKKTERREKRKSLARQRAETHSSGFETSKLRIPEGVEFFKLKEGRMLIDIVPYIAGKGNEYAPQGEEYYERTFWSYNKIGPEEKYLVCPSKTFGHKDFIQEEVQRLSREDNPNKDLIKSLTPKQRQLFLIWDHDAKDKGVQLWEFSYHQFGKALDLRIKDSTEAEGWDLFYFPDTDGMSLRLTVEENKPYGLQVKFIDFVERKEPLPDKIVKHGICLDELLIVPSYEELKAAHLGSDYEKESQSEESTPESEDDNGKDPTASDYGIEAQSTVTYKGKELTVIGISPDGTSLKLLDEEKDKVETAISPADVKLVSKSEVTEEPSSEEGEEVVEMNDSTDGDAPWDNWDD